MRKRLVKKLAKRVAATGDMTPYDQAHHRGSKRLYRRDRAFRRALEPWGRRRAHQLELSLHVLRKHIRSVLAQAT